MPTFGAVSIEASISKFQLPLDREKRLTVADHDSVDEYRQKLQLIFGSILFQ